MHSLQSSLETIEHCGVHFARETWSRLLFQLGIVASVPRGSARIVDLWLNEREKVAKECYKCFDALPSHHMDVVEGVEQKNL